MESFIEWIAEKKLTDCMFILNNVQFQHNSNIVQLVKDNGHSMECVPFSADFSPVEILFNNWQTNIRMAKPNNFDELDKLMIHELNSISCENCDTFFSNVFTRV
ncbi:hypothetical protein A3Q56_08319 [Intoshia linei]|uniref:Tc1-like transposase DDE domain-containing protein n=1 Tax=Intoshia linei TaxID=1819745 RepID=A0A177AQS6_9BILA|nr:hypothetical protein A3Q56_08319 [Intoshia linei]